ncbi:hypothetical protein [Pseudofrankia sp. BMG5.37]|uniref:hypothetical protein n=1 Tax=Pseudofrankia sp. BMG5.37 TaxID=3050035 RepID=UPI0028958F36|nr:hypothetical protein [Pseudofrankia sp. BMG5.37]MDT3439583.1 hypothetical protein [Pseudofrankia sp. BMG5.37]
MSDVTVEIPADVWDKLSQVAADEGLSLRAYLIRLAGSLATPTERAAHAEQASDILREWGYDPTEEELAEHYADLERRIAQIGRVR